MSSDLTQTALDFARECLAWNGAQHGGNQSYVWVPPWSAANCFWYENIRNVMDAVGEVGQRCSLDFSLRRHSSVKDAPYHAKVWGGGTSGECRDADPCQTLLKACVEACRKLKTA